MAKTARVYGPLYDRYLKARDELNVIAREFLDEVKRRAPSRSEDAQSLVDLIIRNWGGVRPKTRSGPLKPDRDDPFERRAAVFDGDQWPEVDAEPLRAALGHCANRFNIARACYNSLSANERKLVRAGVRP